MAAGLVVPMPTLPVAAWKMEEFWRSPLAS